MLPSWRAMLKKRNRCWPRVWVATKVPRPWWRIRMFSATRSSIALRRVPIETPKRSHRRFSDGIASPGDHSLAASASSTWRLTSRYRVVPIAAEVDSGLCMVWPRLVR